MEKLAVSISPHPRARPQVKLLLALILAATLTATWLGAWHEITRNRKSLFGETERAVRFQAHIYAEHTLAIIKRLDGVLLDLRMGWTGDPEHFAKESRHWMAHMNDIAFQIAVIDAQGYLAYSNLAAPAEKIYLGEREHFRVHRENDRGERLFISAPVKGKVSGKWSIQFTRPILSNGRFHGVLVISVSPDAFATFNEKLGLDEEAASAMVANDGAWLARQPDNAHAMGGKIANTPYLAPDAPLTGNFTRIAQADGVERIYGFHRLPEYGLNFVVGHATSRIMLPHRSHRNIVLATATIFSGIAIMLILLAWRAIEVRNHSEDALRESEERYRTLIDHLPMGITVMDGDFNIVLTNQTMELMFGKSPGAFSGHKCYAAYEKRKGPCAHCPGVVAMQTGGTHEVFTQGIRDDGSVMHVHNRAYPHFDATGKIDGFVELVEDITERKHMEQALASSEARWRAIVATEPECVAIVDRRGYLMEMNPAGLAMVQADAPEQVTGRPMADLIAPEYRAAYARLHEQVISGTPQNMEYELKGLRGGRVWVETHAVPMELDGETMHLAITRDIGERKRSEAALRHAKEAAEAANTAKSRFLATMSHEIRTPMNGILGMAQLLLLPNLNDQERKEYARTVLTAGQALLVLLNDILDLSKIEAGRIDLTPAAFDPEHLLAETVTLFMESAHLRGLQFDFTWHGPRGRCYRADPLRLRQMLSNLISNAIKFTPSGAVCVEGREIENGDEHALLEFAVVDSGIGIAPEKLPLLFRPFSQVDDSPTRAHGGTGLGLSIVARLARLMGGDVGVESQPGQGSRFWFRIHADQLPTEIETCQTISSPADASVRRIHALLVEDNPTNRMVIEAMLTKSGMHVDCVANGQQAIATIMDGVRPDMVLMDCQMPVMDGYTATARIRQLEHDMGWRRLPIIALTAGAFTENREHCMAAGMDDFLAKPVDIHDLLSMIEKWSKRSPS